MRNKIKALIITPSRDEYDYYIQLNRLLPYEYPHIMSGENIRGYIDLVAIQIGTWYKIDYLDYLQHYAGTHRIDLLKALQ